MSELKPCPFCGSSDLQDMVGYINCENCDADGPTPNDYTKGWNMRVHPTCQTCRNFHGEYYGAPNMCTDSLMNRQVPDDFYCTHYGARKEVRGE